MGSIINIKKQSVMPLYFLAVIPLLITALVQFGFFDLSSWLPSLITLFAGFFVLAEVGVINMLKGKRFFSDPFRAFGGIVSILAILSGTLGLFNVTWSWLSAWSGLINLALIMYVIIEGVRR